MKNHVQDNRMIDGRNLKLIFLIWVQKPQLGTYPPPPPVYLFYNGWTSNAFHRQPYEVACHVHSGIMIPSWSHEEETICRKAEEYYVDVIHFSEAWRYSFGLNL